MNVICFGYEQDKIARDLDGRGQIAISLTVAISISISITITITRIVTDGTARGDCQTQDEEERENAVEESVGEKGEQNDQWNFDRGINGHHPALPHAKGRSIEPTGGDGDCTATQDLCVFGFRKCAIKRGVVAAQGAG